VHHNGVYQGRRFSGIPQWISAIDRLRALSNTSYSASRGFPLLPTSNFVIAYFASLCHDNAACEGCRTSTTLKQPRNSKSNSLFKPIQVARRFDLNPKPNQFLCHPLVCMQGRARALPSSFHFFPRERNSCTFRRSDSSLAFHFE
jgi:hypothetical protein